MKRVAAWLFLCMSLLLAGSPRAEEKPKLLYFYENYCETCNPEQEFAEDFYARTGETLEGYECALYNIRHPSARAALETVATEYGVENPVQRLPLLIIDGNVYPAASFPEARRAEGTPEPTLAAGESGVLYFYVTACEGCRKAAAVLDALPEDARVERRNIADDPAYALAVFEAYGVPPERQTAPIAFIGDSWLGGAEEIAESLPALLAVGEGRKALRGAGEGGSGFEVSWPGALLAGLVGGLNPCALSMLLLFLTLLAGRGEGLISGSAAFLSAKYVTYLLIGTVFYGVFRAWNPTWLPLVVKILTTVLCLGLILLNLRDARAAAREAYGQVRNQLPTGLRAFLQGRIQRTFAGRVGLLSIALLGMVVAASEFLCAGQVYLASLLSALHAQLSLWVMLPQLAVYCAGFLLPSVLVCLLVALGKNLLDISEFLRKHMPAIKVVTAVFFALMLVLVWVL